MNWLCSLLVGAATGVLSGFGVGGGTLLLLWLTLVQGMGQFQAGGVNLLYFVCRALPALWGHFRHGLVEKQALLWCVLAGLPTCAAGAFLAAWLDTALLRRIFGVFLLVVGLRELFCKKEPHAKSAAHNSHQSTHTTPETQAGGQAGKFTKKG